MSFDFSNITKSAIARSAIGFANVAPPAATAVGSGTPIHFGSIVGILTCGHVVEWILKRQREHHQAEGSHQENAAQVGIVHFPDDPTKFQAMTIDLSAVEAIQIGGSWGSTGPDLGFIRLSQNDFARISSITASVDGEQQVKIAVAPPPTSHAADFVVGLVEGLSRQTVSVKTVRGTIAVTTYMEGLLNAGSVVSTTEQGGFDLCEFKPIPEEGGTLPTSFQATSGGGLWRLYFTKLTDDTYQLAQRRLIGVAFYETPNSQLICHGPESIYVQLRDAIIRKWP